MRITGLMPDPRFCGSSHALLILVLIANLLTLSLAGTAANFPGDTLSIVGGGPPVPITNQHKIEKSGYSNNVRPAYESGGRGDGGGIAKFLGEFLPNTYYSRPKFRYPYYDRNGKGYLLYGYGGKELYEYSVFKPLEGYF